MINHVIDSRDQRDRLKDDTDALVDLAKSIEGGLNSIHGIKAMMASSAEALMARTRFGDRMREHITDDDIFKILIPEYPFGCRRLTPVSAPLTSPFEPNQLLTIWNQKGRPFHEGCAAA